MPFADLDEVKLFYSDDGAGETALLLVHGLGADSHDWIFTIPALSASHRVVAVDLRGHGHSTTPASGYAVDDYVADLVGLLDHLGIERVVAVGHSLGGTIVAHLAVEHPGRVLGVVEVDPAYGYDAAWPAAFQQVADAIDEQGAAATVPGLAAFWTDETPPALRCWHARKTLTVPAHVLADSMREWGLRHPATVLNEDARLWLTRRNAPVLAFYADPTRTAWEEKTFTTTNSSAIGYPGAGHWLHQERPEAFNEHLTTWLDNIH
ncbi:alpha/beta hydrolase [Actinomadura vinacea]|uniref:Alpha/beta hydrolase n=1 Tax=Actinomadura vinacea TaxID=115336 RepID=A0ABN3JKG8_9ACTN